MEVQGEEISQTQQDREELLKQPGGEKLVKEFDELKKKDAENDADDEAEDEAVEEGDQLAPLSKMETRAKRRRNCQGLPMASKGPTTPKQKRNKQGNTDDTPSSNTRSSHSKSRRSTRGKK